MTSVFLRKVEVNSLSGASPSVTWSPHIQQCSFILRWCSLILFCLKLAVTKDASVQRGCGVAWEFVVVVVRRRGTEKLVRRNKYIGTANRCVEGPSAEARELLPVVKYQLNKLLEPF